MAIGGDHGVGINLKLGGRDVVSFKASVRQPADDSAAVDSGISDVVGEKSFSFAEHLLFFPKLIEENQAVRRRHSNCPAGCVGQDAIHAEYVFIFYMYCRLQMRLKQIEPAIEVSNPKTIGAVERQRGDVAVGEQSIVRREYASPASTRVLLLIERAGRDCEKRISVGKDLLDIGDRSR